mgnify:CR=1 FL=1
MKYYVHPSDEMPDGDSSQTMQVEASSAQEASRAYTLTLHNRQLPQYLDFMVDVYTEQQWEQVQSLLEEPYEGGDDEKAETVLDAFLREQEIPCFDMEIRQTIEVISTRACRD